MKATITSVWGKPGSVGDEKALKQAINTLTKHIQDPMMTGINIFSTF
jgi:hypothetical protein